MVFESVDKFNAGKLSGPDLRQRIDVLERAIVELALTTPEDNWTPEQQAQVKEWGDEAKALELCWDKLRADLAAGLP